MGTRPLHSAALLLKNGWLWCGLSVSTNIDNFKIPSLCSTKLLVEVLNALPNCSQLGLWCSTSHSSRMPTPMLQSIAHAMGQHTLAEQNVHGILANIEMSKARQSEKWMWADPAVQLFSQRPHLHGRYGSFQGGHLNLFGLLALPTAESFGPVRHLQGVAIILLVSYQIPQQKFVIASYGFTSSAPSLQLQEAWQDMCPDMFPSFFGANIFGISTQEQGRIQ